MVNNRVRVMKKILLSAIALFALVFAGCNKSELDPVKENTYTHIIKASINDFGTKTTMYGNTVNWEEGDQIALFAEGTTTPVLYTLTEGAGTAEGVFGTNENTEGKVFVAALYPYNAAASFSDGNISTSVAKEYNWEQNANNKAMMAAKITDPESVVFKNAGAVIALTVNNIPAGYNKIVLSSGAAVNGTANISFTDDVPTATMDATADENKSVTIKFEKSVATSNKTFYFPIATTSEAVAFSVNLYEDAQATSLIDNKYTAAQRNNRYYKTINFDAQGSLPIPVGSTENLNAYIQNGLTNFILEDQNATTIEITAENAEELQIAAGTAGETFTIKGASVKGKVILCTPDNVKDLTIDLPNATVEVKPDAGVAAFNRITATTAENTLVIPFGTTIENLIVNNGNVRVFGTVNSFISYKESGLVTIYKESGATIPQELDAAKFEVVDYSEDKFVKTKDALIAALASAADGAVISLGCDIEGLTEILTIGKAITLDGHGHTIVSTAERAVDLGVSAGTVTIKNLNIVAESNMAVNICGGSMAVELKNVKAAAANYCVNIDPTAPGATITIANSDLTGLNTVNVGAANSTVNISDTRIFCNDKNEGEYYGAITINMDAPNSKVNVEGGIMVVNSEDSFGGMITVWEGDIEFSETTKGNTTIEVFSFAIKKGDYHRCYKTLEEAMADCTNGETIILANNYTLPSILSIPADKEIILDLYGNTLSYTSATAGDAMITNNGSLTIKDSRGNGKVSYSYTGTPDTGYTKGNYTIFNNGKLVLENGIIENTTAAMSHASYAVNTNAGSEFIMNDGKVLNLNSHAVRMLSSGLAANNMTMNGGYIEGTRAIQIQLPSNNTATAPEVNLKITGGELKSNEATYNLAIYAYSSGQSAEKVSIEITGGVFNGNVMFDATFSNRLKDDGIKVSGGTFKGIYGIYSYSANDVSSKITINGGTFHGFYAMLYTMYYMGSGEKMDVIMQGNASLTESLVIPKGVTINLDLNGYTLNQEKAQTAAYAMIMNKGTLTVKDSSPEANGKISYKDITTYSSDNNYASNTIHNEGTFTLTSGIIENISNDNVMNYGYPHALDVYPGSTTNIEGGTVKSANYDCIRIFCNSTTAATTVNISGGKIINRVTFQNPSSNQAGYGRLNITGGAFTTTDNVNANVRLLNFSNNVSNMKAVISGGTFDKGVKINNYSSWSANWDWLEISNNAINKLQ